MPSRPRRESRSLNYQETAVITAGEAFRTAAVTTSNRLEEPKKVLSVPSVIQQATNDTDDTDSTFQTFLALEKSLADLGNEELPSDVVVRHILPRLKLREDEEVEYLGATYGRELGGCSLRRRNR